MGKSSRQQQPHRSAVTMVAVAVALTGCGPNAVTVFSSTRSCARWDIAADEFNVYWTDASHQTVMKLALSGGAPVTLAEAQGGAEQILVDSSNLYWWSFDTDAPLGMVVKMPLDRSTSPANWASTQGSPYGMTLDTRDVYWLAGDCPGDAGCPVTKVPIDGSASPSVVASTASKPEVGMAVAGTNVYFSVIDAMGTVELVEAPLGGNSNLSTVDTEGPCGSCLVDVGIASDGTSVYWVTNGDSTLGYVLKRTLAAGNGWVTLASGSSYATGAIAVDESDVYWIVHSSQDTYAVMRVPVVGGTAPTTLATGRGSPTRIALNSSSVFWDIYGNLQFGPPPADACVAATNTIMRCAKN